MMDKDFFGGPDPPNPIYTAAAQTGTNVSTAIANAYLGNVNQNTPYGNLSYQKTDSYNYTDPTTGAMYGIPIFTATQTLSPEQQNLKRLSDLSQEQLGGAAYEQSLKLRQHLGSGLDLSGAPAFGDPNTLKNAPQARTQLTANPAVWGASGGFGDAGPIQSQIGSGGDITKTYGDFANERNRVEQGMMERLNPSLAIERNKYEQQLADQGIRSGSPAYENAMRNYAIQSNDARLGVIGAAGQEQQRMADMAAQRAGFENAAQQQQFSQGAAQGEFANKAQQQLYEQQFGRGTFANQAQQQWFNQWGAWDAFHNAGLAQNFNQASTAFNASNAARQQYLDETFAKRNQPINEVTALLSGSQVSQPKFLNTNSATIPTTDVAGILNKNFDQQMDSFKQSSANINNIIGGLFGLGGNYLKSDRNVKENIDRVGSVFGIDEEGDKKKLPIYRYSYKDDPAHHRHVGPMAQDVEKIDKSAVRKIGGVKHIDVPKLGEILKVA